MQPTALPLIPILAAMVACASIGLVAWSLMSLLAGTGRTGNLRKRLTRAEPGRPRGEETGGGLGSLAQGMAGVFAAIGEKLGPRGGESMSRARTALIQAGIRSHSAPAVFHGCKAMFAAIMAGLFLVGRTLFKPEMPMPWTMGLLILCALVGSYLPEWWLRGRTAKRQQDISDELPDALDLLVVCVEAGMGLDQAIHRVSQELAVSAPFIAAELTTLTRQLRAGKPRPEAMRELAERVGLDDLNSLCTLLIQADLFGISVAQTLRVFSDALRTKRFQRAEEKAAKLPVKLLIPMICCILPALFIAIMGPAGLHLFDVLTKLK
ncbi:MAG: type II secretion system F family protein [Proteobacteria bacterium]|nr:type II secretion system F family protein [Pseudomonadota bacterium]MBU1612152.1 type II secretion system F family protein [Pseudomonadota bacterium]